MCAVVEYVTRSEVLEDVSGIMELVVQEEWIEYSKDFILELLHCGLTAVAVEANGTLLCK